MNLDEKNIHVLYYTPGKNIMGLNKAMQSLHKLYGDRVIALPKDITRFDKNSISIQDLLNIRSMINILISQKLQQEIDNPLMRPDMRAGAVVNPNTIVTPQNNMRPGGGYQPQTGPNRPPSPPTTGSNAVKQTPPQKSGFFAESINVPFSK